MKRNTHETLHGLFEQQVIKNPEKIALIHNDQRMTYDELNKKSNRLAHFLADSGVVKDTPVAIFMNRSMELFITILGILKAGGAYVPLDPSHPEERLLTILNEDNIPLLVTDRMNTRRFNGYHGKKVLVTEALASCQDTNLHSEVTSQNLVYIIYTSGSTGKPKGVLLEHRGIVSYAHWFVKFCQLKSNYLIDFSSSHAFDFAVTTSVVPLAMGLSVIICDDDIKKDPQKYLDYLKTCKANFIKLTPSYFRILLYQTGIKKEPLIHLKKIMLGGENLAVSDLASWLAFYPKHVLFNEYGPTETSVAVSNFRIDKHNVAELGTNAPIGMLIPGSKSYLLDQNGAIVPDGETGELYLGGICVARGYLNNNVMTEKCFIKNPFEKGDRLYRTGDLCRRLPEGELEYAGRIDHQIKIRGFRVEPAEIEQFLTTHPRLKSVVVIAMEDHQNEKKLIAYYIAKNKNNPVSETGLRDFLKPYFPDYMIPSHFISMESFPLNANEKLDRFALPLPTVTKGPNYQKPTTAPEKKLAKIWANELGIPFVGIHDDFFDLGGHSLSAARIISTINHEFSKEISLQTFYESANIAALSRILKKAPKASAINRSTHTIYQDRSTLPLSDFQFTLWLSSLFAPKARKLNICARKRLQGYLDAQKLHAALIAVIEKHEVLSFRVLSLGPLQYFQKNLQIQITEKNLSFLSMPENETLLQNSMSELAAFYPWPKNSPLILVRLFYLQDKNTEIQLCMPHIISDDVSPDILFSDLSERYLSSNQTVKKDTAYREYILNEQNYSETHLERDIAFWEDYLKDAALFTLPQRHILPDMKKKGLAYSIYTEIPENNLDSMKTFCTNEHLSMDDCLTGMLILALRDCCGEALNTATPVCINKVKSTRDDHKYDQTLGCFLSIAPVKLHVDKDSGLRSLCHEVHDSILITGSYQKCSNLVKLASISTFREHTVLIKKYGIKILTWIYGLLPCFSRSSREILNRCARLHVFKDNNFLVNINVHHSFFNPEPENQTLFGLTVLNTQNCQYDLLEIDNVLDICFLRMADHKAYMVISGNLTEEFRKELAKKFLEIYGLEK